MKSSRITGLTVAPLRRMGLRPSESTRYHVGIVLNT